MGQSRGISHKAWSTLSLVILGMINVGIAGATPALFKPGEVIVRYKEGRARTRSAMESLYQKAGVEKIERFRGQVGKFEKLTIREDLDVRQIVQELKADPNVAYAQPNYILKALPVLHRAPSLKDDETPVPPPGDTPTEPVEGNPPTQVTERPPLQNKPADVDPPIADPDLNQAYGILKIGADQAWAQNRGSQDMIVAVIDTGIDYNHEDLAFNVWRNPHPGEKNDIVGYDFVHDDGVPFDDNSHGTHCAGVIGAVGGNGKGISGINQRVSIMALKFLDAQGSGDTVAAVRAIDYAITHGAKVLSNSWGGGADENNNALQEAIARAETAGVLFVAAAGNDSWPWWQHNNDSDPVYPAAFTGPNMITVASTDANDRISFFSNVGHRTVHLGAPGSDVYSSVPSNRYDKMSGTSMACPHVAGAAALLWSAHPEMTYAQVKTRLLETVDPLSDLREKTVSGGRLNVLKALNGTTTHGPTDLH